MDLSTYKNVAITGYFDAADPEGDPLTFQISDSPARGGVTLAEDGSGRVVYTPYENKTGRDSFTYVALDQAGNTSAPATVTLRIEKAGTKVRYADMTGTRPIRRPCGWRRPASMWASRWTAATSSSPMPR